MTRRHAAKRLFEHGPLSEREFVQITGWPFTAAHSAILALLDSGVIESFHESGTSRKLYRLA